MDTLTDEDEFLGELVHFAHRLVLAVILGACIGFMLGLAQQKEPNVLLFNGFNSLVTLFLGPKFIGGFEKRR